MVDRLFAFLFWIVLLAGAPAWLALFLALDLRSALGRRRYRAVLAGARARVRAIGAGVLELTDGASVDARAIVSVDWWEHTIDGGYAGNNEEEYALRFQTADGANYVMVTGFHAQAEETLRSLGFTPGRPRRGGHSVVFTDINMVLIPFTLLWLAIVPKLIRRF